ncbi:hypothetical protein PPERSA_12783 [Pseudocohnilembus persalinus]|uniref:Uncharacterized protein n=1 Tax=Pseudocohnilembus persalinus TaxID=266149 RepID=A0A0V0Q7H2_PSEPJ|nr:hypothetical protein PPERSA_12783 [Pseudocohnilembus persalinus]|eukprot:KRW98129.1 hypothetical protein PPERSA_12783 [Pseudocohnilembus persalinus]
MQQIENQDQEQINNSSQNIEKMEEQIDELKNKIEKLQKTKFEIAEQRKHELQNAYKNLEENIILREKQMQQKLEEILSQREEEINKIKNYYENLNSFSEIRNLKVKLKEQEKKYKENLQKKDQKIYDQQKYIKQLESKLNIKRPLQQQFDKPKNYMLPNNKQAQLYALYPHTLKQMYLKDDFNLKFKQASIYNSHANLEKEITSKKKNIQKKQNKLVYKGKIAENEFFKKKASQGIIKDLSELICLIFPRFLNFFSIKFPQKLNPTFTAQTNEKNKTKFF